MRRDDWLLAQLPIGMMEDDFFCRFVGIFQEMASTLVDGADNIGNVLDLTVTPEPMVQWLGSWIGAVGVDTSLPSSTQRRLVRAAGEMLAWRGTVRGLRQLLELISGAPAHIEEGGGVHAEGDAPVEPAWVRVHVLSTGWLTEEDFLRIVRDEVPAHAALEVWAGSQKIWPKAAIDLTASSRRVALEGTSQS
jgi:phage tail-like protein